MKYPVIKIFDFIYTIVVVISPTFYRGLPIYKKLISEATHLYALKLRTYYKKNSVTFVWHESGKVKQTKCSIPQ